MRDTGVITALILLSVLLLGALSFGSGVARPTAEPGVQAPQYQSPMLAQDQTPVLAQGQPEPDNTITRINLSEDGTAVWRLTLRTRLVTDADVAEYERFQRSFENDTDRYLAPFEERMRGVVATANRTSDREMRATGFTATTSIQQVPRRWGVVTFSFSWDGFGRVDGDQITMGDVFGSGFFIGEEDVLEVTAPDEFVISDAEPRPDESGNATVEWHGREDFGEERPSLVISPTDTGGGTPSGQDETTESSPNYVLIALAAGVVLLVGSIVFAVWRDRMQVPTTQEDPNDESGTRSSQAAGEISNTDDPGDRSDGELAPEAGLVTDEGRVEKLLGENGGRMKQSAIVDELGWSKSKTSRVLSGMAEDGTVEKLRIGRENVIALPDETDADRGR